LMPLTAELSWRASWLAVLDDTYSDQQERVKSRPACFRQL